MTYFTGSRQSAVILTSFFACVAVAGCTPAPPTQTDISATPVTTASPAGVDAELLAANDQPVYDAPPPKEKPVGVVIAFPVPGGGADQSARDFASGVGYYLSVAVAGAPEFGQSPLRTTVSQVARERNIPSLRMPPGEAARVARVCGATHFATGTYAETADRITLAYELRPIADGAKTSAAVSVSAPDRKALLEQLPPLARKLRAALAATGPTVTVPPLSAVTPDEIATIGACADAASYTAEQTAFLLETGKRVPLAAGLAVFVPSLRAAPKSAAPYVRLLLETTPTNTQVLGSLGYAVPGALRGDAPAIYALSERYPESYPLAHCAAWTARTGGDWQRDARYSRRGAQNAPANPEARLAAAWSVMEQARRLRQDRQYYDIAPAVMAKIQPLYAEWLEETAAATKCDPLYGKAYQRLANAALFAGDSSAADEAMTMARKLYTDSPYETYTAALEMYQPKWGGDPARLLEVATEAADARYNTNNESLEVYQKLGALQFTTLQQKMGDRLFQETEQTIARNPKDMYAHYLHGSIAHDRGKRREALADFVANAQNYPANPGVLFELGRHYVNRSQFDKAEVPLRKSILLRPRNAETLHYLGYALKHQNKLPEAQKFLEAAIAVTPDYADALALLGTVNAMRERVPEAIRYYERALRVRPFQPEACVNLATCYNFEGRPREAIQIGNQFMRYYRDDLNMSRVLGEAYARNGDWAESEQMNRSVLARSPGDGNAHAYLGDALWGQKKKAEARDEWQAAVRIGSPEDAVKHAKAQLKKYPAS